MLLIMVPDQYPNYYKVLENYTGYFDSLDIMILISYPSSIVITRDYCMCFSSKVMAQNVFLHNDGEHNTPVVGQHTNCKELGDWSRRKLAKCDN